MDNFKRQYRDLEMRVLSELRKLVEGSSTESQHISTKAVVVSIQDYTELTIVNGRLTFLDSKGLQYSIFANTNLEELIDLLQVIAGANEVSA